MKTLKVGVLTNKFIDWGGGIDFIRLILNGLSSIDRSEGFEVKIYVFIPKISENNIKVKNFLKKVINRFSTNELRYQSVIGRKSFIGLFKAINSDIEILFYDKTEENLIKLAKAESIDFLLPAFLPLSSKCPIKWAGYIFDFQHKYYPEFFTAKEVEFRNRQFLTMTSLAKTVIVNAVAVKNDIGKFLGDSSCKVLVLPFCPVLNLDFFDLELPLNYDIPKEYFIISNQFWKHKDHTTAFVAFREFLEKADDKNVGLVCTGQTYDDRFPNYFGEIKQLVSQLGLERNIYILGFVPKKDQLALLKHSIAVIQPTLFEGGPGGGAVYESVAYGIRSIVSDIPVNKEIDDETVTFFKTGSSKNLSEEMSMLYKNKRIDYTSEYLVKKNEKQLKKMGERFLEVFNSY